MAYRGMPSMPPTIIEERAPEEEGGSGMMGWLIFLVIIGAVFYFVSQWSPSNILSSMPSPITGLFGGKGLGSIFGGGGIGGLLGGGGGLLGGLGI